MDIRVFLRAEKFHDMVAYNILEFGRALLAGQFTFQGVNPGKHALMQKAETTEEMVE